MMLQRQLGQRDFVERVTSSRAKTSGASPRVLVKSVCIPDCFERRKSMAFSGVVCLEEEHLGREARRCG